MYDIIYHTCANSEDTDEIQQNAALPAHVPKQGFVHLKGNTLH